MGCKVLTCEHVFIGSSGGRGGFGMISYHGNCRTCGVPMSVYGKVDSRGSGEVVFRTDEGSFRQVRKVVNWTPKDNQEELE